MIWKSLGGLMRAGAGFLHVGLGVQFVQNHGKHPVGSDVDLGPKLSISPG